MHSIHTAWHGLMANGMCKTLVGLLHITVFGWTFCLLLSYSHSVPVFYSSIGSLYMFLVRSLPKTKQLPGLPNLPATLPPTLIPAPLLCWTPVPMPTCLVPAPPLPLFPCPRGILPCACCARFGFQVSANQPSLPYPSQHFRFILPVSAQHKKKTSTPTTPYPCLPLYPSTPSSFETEKKRQTYALYNPWICPTCPNLDPYPLWTSQVLFSGMFLVNQCDSGVIMCVCEVEDLASEYEL